MGYSTSVFTYIPRKIVITLSGNSERAYMQQYASQLTLNKGVDNRIQFQFLNQQQKPVDISDLVITCRVLNADGTAVLIAKTLDLDLPLTGIASLSLDAAALRDIESQKGYYTLEIPSGDYRYPVFTDQNAGARGDMNIVDSILPSFVPSSNVTIPTGQTFPNIANGNISANGLVYHTSVINTEANPILTIQAKYDEFYGNVLINGSTQVDSNWYPIELHEYANTSNTIGYTLVGFHPFVQMVFTSNAGAVTNIIAR